MIRRVFYLLLAANLLVFMWQLWLSPGESGPGTPENLASLEYVPLPDEPLTEPMADLPDPPGCLRIGPFAEEERVLAASRQLAERGVKASVTDEQAQVWRGHWVQIFAEGDRDAVNAIVADVRSAGVQDAYVVSWDPSPRISLGVFRQRDRAEVVIARAQGIGLEPVMTDRYSAAIAWWLTVASNSPGEIDISSLADAAGQIVRSEPVDCSGTADVPIESTAAQDIEPE